MDTKAGDPDFAIASPSNNDQVIPNISVWGWCVAINPGDEPTIRISVGNGTPQTPMLNLGQKTWEVILTNVAAGPQEITATCNSHDPQSVTVNVASQPPLTVNEPTPPSPRAAAVGGNPWAGWTVTGTYDKTKVTKIELYITRKGNQLPGNEAADLKPDNGTWSLALDKFPIAAFTGAGFCVHAHASTSNGAVRGSCPGFFTVGPRSDDD